MNHKLTVRLDIRIAPECYKAIVAFGKRHKWRKSQAARELLERALRAEGLLRGNNRGEEAGCGED